MLRDAHVHMTRLPSFIETVSILKSKKVTAVSSACAPWEWPILEKLSHSFENIEAAYGLHPYEIGPNYQKDLEKCLDYLKQNPDSKVGETGIDRRFPGYAPKEEQESVFIFQAKVALELKRPLIIHCVGDHFFTIDHCRCINPDTGVSFPLYFPVSLVETVDVFVAASNNYSVVDY